MRAAKFLDSLFGFFYSFAAAELLKDRCLDQALNRQTERQGKSCRRRAERVQQRRIQHSEEPVFFPELLIRFVRERRRGVLEIQREFTHKNALLLLKRNSQSKTRSWKWQIVSSP